MGEWKEYKLNEVGLLKRGKSKYRPRYAFHLYGGPYPFIQTGDVKAASKYVTSFSQTYSEDGLKQSMLWEKGTLCITIAANIADIAMLGFDACFPDSILGFQANEDVCNQNFVYYLLLCAKKELLMHADGSVQDNINLGTFETVKFLFPSLPTQNAIAEILSSLDDKIDLLTRQNTTLEALAQTYFRQWFVDDGINKEIELGSLAHVTTGKGLKKDKYRDAGKYAIWGANGEIGRTDEFLTQEEVILTGRVGTHGKVFIVNNKVWISDNVLIIKPHKANYKYALYFLLLSLDYESLNVGSTQPLITQTDLKKQTCFATTELFEKFHNQVSLYFDKIEQNNAQIQILQKLRDTLLPKLVSGEVSINMEKITKN